MLFRELSDGGWELIKPLLPPMARTGRPKEVTGASAYDAKGIRSYFKRRGIKANIDVNPRSRGKPKRGRLYRPDRKAYKSVRSTLKGSSHR